MDYTTRAGNTYELATMDKKLLAIQERVDKAQSVADRFDAMMDYAKASLPKEAVEEELGTTSTAKVSLPDLGIVYNRLVNSYWGEYNRARLDEAMAQLEPVKDIIDSVSKLGKISRQGFANVR